MNGQVEEWVSLTRKKINGKLSWDDEVKAQDSPTGKVKAKVCTVWDSFDVSKIDNAGFKLEYIDPINVGYQLIRAIDAKGIISEVKL